MNYTCTVNVPGCSQQPHKQASNFHNMWPLMHRHSWHSSQLFWNKEPFKGHSTAVQVGRDTIQTFISAVHSKSSWAAQLFDFTHSKLFCSHSVIQGIHFKRFVYLFFYPLLCHVFNYVNGHPMPCTVCTLHAPALMQLQIKVHSDVKCYR